MSREDADVAEEMLRILTAEGIEVCSTPSRSVFAAVPETRSPSRCGRRRARRRSKAAICSWRPDVSQTPPISDSTRPGVELDARGFSASTTTGNDGVRRLGNRRMRRQPAIHACFRRRLPDRQGQYGRRQSQNRRTAGSLCHVHRSAPRSRGLSEGEAQRKDIPVRVARLPMGNVLRTEATDETKGFMKWWSVPMTIASLASP